MHEVKYGVLCRCYIIPKTRHKIKLSKNDVKNMIKLHGSGDNKRFKISYNANWVLRSIIDLLKDIEKRKNIRYCNEIIQNLQCSAACVDQLCLGIASKITNVANHSRNRNLNNDKKQEKVNAAHALSTNILRITDIC